MLDAHDILTNIHEYVYMGNTNYGVDEQRDNLLKKLSEYISYVLETDAKFEMKTGPLPATHIYNTLYVEIFGEKMTLMDFSKKVTQYVTQYNRAKKINNLL